MSIFRNFVESRRILLLSLLPLTLTGCRSEPFMEGGPEIRYLTSTPPAPKIVVSKAQPLLPLAVGTTWEMTSLGGNAQVSGRVIGPDESGGTLIEFLKSGVLWRREVYKNTESGLLLTAMGEDDKPLMRLTPPVLIAGYPLREGEGHSQTGTFRFGKFTYPMDSYSRISAVEKIQGSAGDIQTYRVDTLVTINQNGRLVKFPTLQWLAPGTGFIRRSFVDAGRPTYVKLQKFSAR